MKKKFLMLLFFTIYHLPVTSLPFTSPALAVEPSLRQLEKAALRYSGTDPQEVRNWKSRSRWAAALPQVTVGFDQNLATQINNNIQDSISVTSSGVTVGPPQTNFRQDDDFNQGFNVKASWALDELLFNRDSLSISAESRYRTVIRSQVLDDLHTAYFERKKILLNSGGTRELLPALIQLRLEELEAKLDSLTGGVFSQITQGDKNEN